MSEREKINPGETRLPEIVPIFPLSGVLLLPRGRLPLNVFEPRYLNMTRDALADPDPYIGIVQPRRPERQHPDDRPAVYGTGCLGRITAHREIEGGQLLVSLAGVSRFDIVRELPEHRLYRRAAVDYRPYRADLRTEATGAIDRDRLLATLKGYFPAQGLAADWDAINDSSDEYLVTGLSMVCPFTPREKQALLESPDMRERCRVIIALMEMSMLGEQGEGARH